MSMTKDQKLQEAMLVVMLIERHVLLFSETKDINRQDSHYKEILMLRKQLREFLIKNLT